MQCPTCGGSGKVWSSTAKTNIDRGRCTGSGQVPDPKKD